MASQAMLQLYEMQTIIRKVVETMSKEVETPSLSPYDRANFADAMSKLVDSWEKLEERKRIMKGRPLPGTLKHIEVKRRGNRVADLMDVEIIDEPNGSRVLTESIPQG